MFFRAKIKCFLIALEKNNFTMDFEHSGNLKLPLLLPNQSGKEITHNEALIIVDNLLHNHIQGELSAPPAEPIRNDLFIVGADAEGAWAGKEGSLAFYDNGWRFVEPRAGFIFWSDDKQIPCVFNGENWQSIMKNFKLNDLKNVSIDNPAENDLIAYDGENFVNSSSTTVNNLNIKNGLNFTKNAVPKSRFQLKNETNNLIAEVSPDGSSWHESFEVDGADGSINFLGEVSIGGTPLSNLLGSNISQEDVEAKADTDGSNVTEDFFTGATLEENTVDYVVESHRDENGNWYRKYKSGWISQGGIFSNTGTPNGGKSIAVNFNTPFQSVCLSCMMQIYSSSSSVDWLNTRFTLSFLNSLTNFNPYLCIISGATNSTLTFHWRADGI
ncbi:MAG: DUF2793 domain-containing protein [Rickettsiales bacterium]|nr:DUF2793 domain-containing protein [Rickettsiales bacterium]